MDNISYLIVPLLQGFEWFDEGLQGSLRARGWPRLTRPESIVLIHVILDITRPAEIARSLGVTRQAVHTTIGQIVEKGIFEITDDPADKRSTIVALTALGKAMRRDAQLSVQYITAQLSARIGEEATHQLREAFAKDWGAPVICPLYPKERAEVRRRQRTSGGEVAKLVTAKSAKKTSATQPQARRRRSRA